MRSRSDVVVRWWAGITVATVATVLYLPALDNGFVVDDRHLIVGNRHVEDPSGVLDAFTVGMWEFAGRTPTYYRPLMYVAYAAVHRLAGPTPSWFHALNVLLHAVASVLVWGIARGLLARRGSSGPVAEAAAIAAGLVFAAHPAQAEAVVWVAALPDVASGALRLAALAGAVAAYFAALLFKEPAILFPAVLAVHEGTRRSGRGIAVRFVRRIVPFVAATAAYLVVRVGALGALLATVPDAGRESPDRIALTAASLWTRYLVTLAFPDSFGFGAVHRPPEGWASGGTIQAGLAVLAFLVATIVALRRRSAVAVGVAVVALPLLPSFRLLVQPQGAGTPFAERFLYLPVAGVAVLVAIGLAKLPTGRPAVRIVAAGVVLVALGASACEVRTRIPAWRSDLSLWAASVDASPEGAVGHLNLGLELVRAGETEAGRRHLDRAVELDPEIPDDELRRAVAWAEAGETGRAVLGIHAVLLLTPDSAPAYFNLGLVHEARGELVAAVAAYRAAVRADPELADGHNNLGVVLAEGGDLRGARPHFEEAVRLRPDDPEFVDNLRRVRRALADDARDPGTSPPGGALRGAASNAPSG